MRLVNGKSGPARPGRKRSEESRQAILAAALGLTADVGYAGLTVDGIAARSGTGKQTIYRWWPSKDDVLLEALADRAALDVLVPDQGSYQADLHAFLMASFALSRQPQVPDILRALMARAQIDEEFGQRFRASFLQRRRDAPRSSWTGPRPAATCPLSWPAIPWPTSCSASSGTGCWPAESRSATGWPTRSPAPSARPVLTTPGPRHTGRTDHGQRDRL